MTTAVWKYVKRLCLIYEEGESFFFLLMWREFGGEALEMLNPHAAPRQLATNSALKQRNESDRLMWIGFGTPSARLRLPPHARPGGKV